ncbi:MAG: hypothetical protein QMD80_01070 [archaeon]|nr:hypothetical protein [archaeon]
MKSSGERPELFGLEEIDELLEVAGTIGVKEIITPIEGALEKIRESLVEMKLLPGVDRVVLRTQTLQALLFHITEALGEKRYKETLKLAGETIGISFAKDYLSFLRVNKKLPANEEVLINFWTELDTRSNWGDFSTKYEGDKIIIEIQNNFLTRNLDENKHRHCAFIEGYIQGFLWEALKEYYRWFTKAITRPALPPLEPISVSENKSGDICIFVVRRAEEELVDAFDKFYEAKDAYLLRRYNESVVSIRAALESALKQKTGLDIHDRKTSFELILKAYKQMEIFPPNLSVRKVKDIWGTSSAVIHSSKALSRKECENLIEVEAGILKTLELIKIDEATKMELQRLIEETRRPKPENETE